MTDHGDDGAVGDQRFGDDRGVRARSRVVGPADREVTATGSASGVDFVDRELNTLVRAEGYRIMPGRGSGQNDLMVGRSACRAGHYRRRCRPCSHH